MKYFSSKFEGYIIESNKYNLHNNMTDFYNVMNNDFKTQNNLIFYPEKDTEQKEINKGLIFYNKDKKIVGAFHKDSKDKSDLIIRSGYSDESAFGLTERIRINNSENRIKISGALDADQLCLGSTCITKADLDKLKKL